MTIDQTVIECDICRAFTPRAYSRRFYRVAVQCSGGVNKRISDTTAKECIKFLKETGTPFNTASTVKVRDLTDKQGKFVKVSPLAQLETQFGCQGQDVQPVEPFGGDQALVAESGQVEAPPTQRFKHADRHVSGSSRPRGTPKAPQTVGSVVERGAHERQSMVDRVVLVTKQITGSLENVAGLDLDPAVVVKR